MASSSHTTPDTLITLKINHDGLTKKVKLPLRDLGASALEDKVCQQKPSAEDMTTQCISWSAAYAEFPGARKIGTIPFMHLVKWESC